MTNKVQKIREEIERIRSLHQIKYQHLDVNDNMCLVECGMRNLCNDLLLFIDSLQEEPVSEDLEEAAHKYADIRMSNYETAFYAFMSGAQWKEQQFENNRLAHCDAQTNEEAEREQDFVTGIIDKEHRLPTFDDAIKYGIRLKEKEMQSTIELAEDHAMLAGMEKMKEEMMAKAIDGEILEVEDNDCAMCSHTHLELFIEPDTLEENNFKDGDKVKVIVIKED